MTEQTYGLSFKRTLAQIEECPDNYEMKDMAAHIRELQAENAKLKASTRVDFIGLDPFNIGKGAVHPMIPDSWRYGFIKQGDELLFCAQDNGPLVAYGALLDEIAKLKAERREFGMRIANTILAASQSKGYSGEMYKTHIAAIVEQELNK